LALTPPELKSKILLYLVQLKPMKRVYKGLHQVSKQAPGEPELKTIKK